MHTVRWSRAIVVLGGRSGAPTHTHTHTLHAWRDLPQSPFTTTVPGRMASKLTMLSCFRKKRGFLLLLHILISVSTSPFPIFYTFPCSWCRRCSPATLSSACFLAASFRSSSLHSICGWCSLLSVFRNFRFDSPPPPSWPWKAPSSRPLLLGAAAATVTGDPLHSFTCPLPDSAFVPSAAFNGSPHADSTVPGCSGNLSRRTHTGGQPSPCNICVRYARFRSAVPPSLRKPSAPGFPETLGAAPNSIHRLSPAAAVERGSSASRAAPTAPLSLSAAAQRQEGQWSTFRRTSTSETALRIARRLEGREQLEGNQRGPASSPMAAFVTGPAASADGRVVGCPHAAAGVCLTARRRVAVAALVAGVHGGLPGGAPGRAAVTVAAVAPLRNVFRASAATALHTSAFPLASASLLNAHTTAFVTESEWRSRATARRSVCTGTKPRESYGGSSSPCIAQEQQSQQQQWHRCTRLLAKRPAWMLQSRKSWISLQQPRSSIPRLQPTASSSHSTCSQAALSNKIATGWKYTRIGGHSGTAIHKEIEEAVGCTGAGVASASGSYATAIGRRSYAGGSPAAGAPEADVEAAAAAAENELRPHQIPQQRGDGPPHSHRFTHTKQIATIGPASWSYEEIERLFLSGVDVFRLNLSHGLLHEKHQQLQHVRSLEKKYGHPIAVLADLPGPKLRLGSFEGGDAIFLPEGASFIIDNAVAVLGNQQRVALHQHTEILQALRAGDVLLLDDGKLKLRVVRQLDCSKETYQQLLLQKSRDNFQQEQQQRKHGEEQQEQQQGQKKGVSHDLQEQQRTSSVRPPQIRLPSFPDRVVGVECVVAAGGPLSGKKGVNIPAAALPLSALSARDRELARLVAGWGVDWIALSFVQRAEDIRELRKELNAQAALLAKETVVACDGSNNGGDPALRQSNTAGETGEPSVYGREQPVQRPHAEQHEKENKETDVEQESRLLRSSVKSLEESFAAFSPSHVHRGGGVAVIVKIEKPVALENIEEILEEADGLMVARGDLGVELAEHAAWLPVVQKRLVKLCQEAGKPVVIATQMLDSMTHARSPTRAELTDVANAVYDGADAVMLSGETAAGDAPAHVAKTQFQGIQAVEGDPHFWRLQSATRALLLAKEAARAASCRLAEAHTASSQATCSSSVSSHGGSGSNTAAHGDHRGNSVMEQGVASRAAAAGGAGEAFGEGQEQVRPGDDREKLVSEKEEQIELDVHEEHGVDLSVGEHEQYAVRGHRTRQRRLFPELRTGHLLWKNQLTRGSDAQVEVRKAENFAAAARRAAAGTAASFVGDESWLGGSHRSTRDRRGRRSSSSRDAHTAWGMITSAGNSESLGETENAHWIAAAAEQASRLSRATSIVIFEETGEIARRVAALRPVVPVVAVTPSVYVARELQLHWGIYPVVDAAVWEAAKDRLEKGETAEERGGRATDIDGEGMSERVGAAEAGNEDVHTTNRAADTPDTSLEKFGKGSDSMKTQVTTEGREPGPSFGTQMCKAATLLIREGMADAKGDEEAVIVGGFYTRKEGTGTSGRHQESATFLPQISVCPVRAFV